MEYDERQIIMNEFVEFEQKCREEHEFVDCEFLERFKALIDTMVVSIPKGNKFYRARIYDDKIVDKISQAIDEITEGKDLPAIHHATDKGKSYLETIEANRKLGFWGYDKQGSYINPDRFSVREGRCNHKYEICLYVAEDPQTAIGELKPLIREKISVACICNICELQVIDFTMDFNKESSIFKNIVALAFMQSPTERNKDAYLYTEVLCSFVKKMGYDGVIYNSCQNINKTNYAIFNYKKCEPIDSFLYEVNAINYVVTNVTINSERYKKEVSDD